MLDLGALQRARVGFVTFLEKKQKAKTRDVRWCSAGADLYDFSRLFSTHPEDVFCVGVVHLHVDLPQEVLQLLQGHLVVLVLVRLAHAVDDPADSLM